MHPLMVCFAVFAYAILTVAGHEHHHEEDYGPARYKFEYAVHDPHTGDKKHQHEVRDGHVVKGSYSLEEPDGTTRIVEYVAGPHTGFNAIVRRIGHAHHPQHYHHYRHHGGDDSGYGGASYGGAYSTVGVTHFGYEH